MDLRYREIILFVCLTTKLLSTRFLYSMNQTCHCLVRNTSPLSCAPYLQQFYVILCISSTHTKYSACSFVYLFFLLETNESKFILGGNSTLYHKCRVLNPKYSFNHQDCMQMLRAEPDQKHRSDLSSL